MVKAFALLLALLYNVVTFGATLQVHTCGSDVLWSLSKTENPHDDCPFCHRTPAKDCNGGGCHDIELKLDQLSDQFFMNNKDVVQVVDTAIITLPWLISPNVRALPQNIHSQRDIFVYSDSSPPTYILLCTFRI